MRLILLSFLVPQRGFALRTQSIEPIEENLSAPHQFLQAMSHTQMFQQ
jgi:hypothetical protein